MFALYLKNQELIYRTNAQTTADSRFKNINILQREAIQETHDSLNLSKSFLNDALIRTLQLVRVLTSGQTEEYRFKIYLTTEYCSCVAD